MKSRYVKKGFTLVEILVAMTIIVAIVSMVYGSYFAISKSTQACKSRIALSQQGRKVLRQMARQIRCSYAAAPQKSMEISENAVSYFNSDQDNPDGEILHLITTGGFWTNKDSIDGPFEVAYKFDENKGVLFLSQRRFIGLPENDMQKRNWRPVITNISSIELAFFDGRQWQKIWNFNDRKRLPSAVKLDITCEDENSRPYHYGTIVDVYCRENQSEKTQVETLVATKK
ncbi:MAG: type II secretion system protein GspJ [Phycisphaerae bacterium]|jgi:type II secretion system protein J